MLPTPKKRKWCFPHKLYTILESADHSIASWYPDGRSFTIHEPDTFMRQIVPRYFKQTKFRSFTRQMNMWGFENLQQGKWAHPHFIRGNIAGLELIERQKENPNRRETCGNHEDARPGAARSECDIGSEIGSASKQPAECLPQSESGSGSYVAPSDHLNEESNDGIEETNGNDNINNQSNNDDDLFRMSKSVHPSADAYNKCRCSFCL
ncbi:hypothetical protein ACHAWF_011934 [Thalassiosira exigua]